jgi:hypothetical protein
LAQPIEPERGKKGSGKDHMSGLVDMYPVGRKVIRTEPCKDPIEGGLCINEDCPMLCGNLADLLAESVHEGAHGCIKVDIEVVGSHHDQPTEIGTDLLDDMIE